MARNMRHLSVIAVALMYAFCAGVVIYAMSIVFTPCTNNFEGGCSMGKGLLLLGSLVPAAGAIGSGALLGSLLAGYPRMASTHRYARQALMGVPILFCAGAFVLMFS